MTVPVLEARGLSVVANGRPILRDVSFAVPPSHVFALIGPSGAGKSTLLKTLNRLLDLAPGFRVSGEVLLDGRSVFAPDVCVDDLRARVGMIFQQPVVFPKSILENVVFGARFKSGYRRQRREEVAESALREAALWDEVRDRLRDSALKLSVGQQQRLCLARTLAMNPEVILMDEPTSALDPRSTEAIETLILKLRESRSIVLVTHQIEQARRVADCVASMSTESGMGRLGCRCNMGEFPD